MRTYVRAFSSRGESRLAPQQPSTHDIGTDVGTELKQLGSFDPDNGRSGNLARRWCCAARASSALSAHHAWMAATLCHSLPQLFPRVSKVHVLTAQQRLRTDERDPAALRSHIQRPRRVARLRDDRSQRDQDFTWEEKQAGTCKAASFCSELVPGSSVASCRRSSSDKPSHLCARRE